MRLIDADAFDERIRLAVGSCEEELTEDFKDGIQTVLEMMKTAPTVDAVPVVWCGECKYMMPDGHCTMFADDRIRPSSADFCSAGERKDGDGHEST